jgi:hypothetical protein
MDLKDHFCVNWRCDGVQWHAVNAWSAASCPLQRTVRSHVAPLHLPWFGLVIHCQSMNTVNHFL